jgi:hypothetical protein
LIEAIYNSLLKSRLIAFFLLFYGQTDYPFNEEDSEKNLIFTPETVNQPRPSVKAGKLEKLIERLTYEKYPGTRLVPPVRVSCRVSACAVVRVRVRWIVVDKCRVVSCRVS